MSCGEHFLAISTSLTQAFTINISKIIPPPHPKQTFRPIKKSKMKPFTLITAFFIAAVAAVPASDVHGSDMVKRCDEAACPGCQLGAVCYDKRGAPLKPDWKRCDEVHCPGCQFGAKCD